MELHLLLNLLLIVNSAFSLKNSSLYRLHNDLLFDYDPDVRPRRDYRDAVAISVVPILYEIAELRSQKSTLLFVGGLHTYWKDDFLQWDPSNYDNLSRTSIPKAKIWTPCILLYESKQTFFESEGRAFVRHTGDVEYDYVFVNRVTCEINVRYFPWDEQHCLLTYGQQNFLDLDYIIQNGSIRADTEAFTMSPGWYYEGTSVSLRRFPLPPEIAELWGLAEPMSQPVMELTVSMRRDPTYFVIVLVVPSIIVCSCAIIATFTPFDARGQRRQKATVGLTSFLALLMLQLNVGTQLPQAGSTLPIITVYLLLLSLLIAMAILCGTVILALDQPPSRKLPSWAKHLFLYKLGWLPLVPKTSRNKDSTSLSSILQSVMLRTTPKFNGRRADNSSQTTVGVIELDDLRKGLQQISQQWPIVSEFLRSTVKREQEKADWSNFVNVLERLFFIFFSALLVILVIALFWHHLWY